MPLLLIAVFTLFIFHAPAWADWVLVYSIVTNPPQPAGGDIELTVKIKDRKMRVDTKPSDIPTPLTSMISDGSSPETIMMMHPQRMYSKYVVATREETYEKLNKQLPAGSETLPPPLPAEPTKLQATGKSEKIGSYDAEEYIFESGTKKTILWIAKDFPDFETINTAMRNATNEKSMTWNPMSGVTFPGMALRIESSHGAVKSTVTLISAQEVSLSTADFEPPADYTEMPQR